MDEDTEKEGENTLSGYKRHTVVDLFCGCGGFSLGMLRAGFEVVAAVDNNIMPLATYWYNLCDENTRIIGEIPRKHAHYFNKPGGYRINVEEKDRIPAVRALFCKNILDVTGWEIMAAAGVDAVDVVIGSPPCQSFSKANTRKKTGDLRDYLLFEFGRVIMEINPSTFMMENVPPIIKAKLPDGRGLIDTFKKMVGGMDWELYYELRGIYPFDMGEQACEETGHQCTLPL